MATSRTPPDKKRVHETGNETSEAKSSSAHPLTIEDLGWTEQEAARIRQKFATFAEDWDDPAMDVYNDL